MRLLSKLGVGVLTLAAALTVNPSPAHAMNASRQIGYGAKSKGMGGVGIALPQDSLVAAMNPAGMPYVADRWDIGLGYVFQDADTRSIARLNDGGFEDHCSDVGIWLPEAGVSWMFCPCQVLGVSIYVDSAFSTEYNRRILGYSDPVFDGGSNVEAWNYNLVVAPSWSWRINTVHSIGVALNIAITGLNFQGYGTAAALSFFPNDATNRGTAYSEGVSVRVGWLGNLCNRFMAGFTFQTRTWVRKYRKYQGLLHDAGESDLPGSLGVGATWFPWSCVALSAEYQHVIWNKVTNSFWGAREFFGGVNGPGVSWNAQGIFKVGGYWRILPCLTLRLGYNWGQSPISCADTIANVGTQQIIEHHITTGATYRFDCNEITFYYYYGFSHRIRGEIPILPLQIPNGYNLRNEQQAVGLSYGRIF